jgi:hypothetical protein
MQRKQTLLIGSTPNVELHKYAGKRPDADEFAEMTIAQLRADLAALPPVSGASVRAMPAEEINRQMALLFALREAERAYPLAQMRRQKFELSLLATSNKWSTV